MKIYLIRHGDPDYENDTLTPQGHKEASALVAYLKNEGIDRVISSPRGRAQDTAAYTAQALGMQAEVKEWLTEISLRAEGEGDWHAAWDIHGHSIRNPEYLSDPSRLESIPAMPAAEAATITAELRKASDEFLADLGYRRVGGVYQVDRRSEERIAVFAHGGLGLSWLALLLEIPLPIMWSGFFLHTSSVTQVLFDEREPGIATPRCIMMSALPHLYAAGMAAGTAGIKANYT